MSYPNAMFDHGGFEAAIEARRAELGPYPELFGLDPEDYPVDALLEELDDDMSLAVHALDQLERDDDALIAHYAAKDAEALRKIIDRCGAVIMDQDGPGKYLDDLAGQLEARARLYLKGLML